MQYRNIESFRYYKFRKNGKHYLAHAIQFFGDHKNQSLIRVIESSKQKELFVLNKVAFIYPEKINVHVNKKNQNKVSVFFAYKIVYRIDLFCDALFSLFLENHFFADFYSVSHYWSSANNVIQSEIINLVKDYLKKNKELFAQITEEKTGNYYSILDKELLSNVMWKMILLEEIKYDDVDEVAKLIKGHKIDDYLFKYVII